MRKDIFNGNIKREYFSYILTTIIVVAVIFFGCGGLFLCFSLFGDLDEATSLLLLVFSVLSFLFGVWNSAGTIFVIRKYPKHKKFVKWFLNSDCYFTDSTSNEYFGESKTIRGRRNKAAFDLVTSFAELEKAMGDKKPVRYTVYSALATLMAVLGLVILIAAPILFDNGAILPNMSDGVFAFCYISGGLVCIAFAVFFLDRACKVALMAPFENHKWISELYTSLVDIAVRKNNKKLKFWYDEAQLDQIANLVKSASENAELKLERKGDKLVLFDVIDTSNNRVVFTGLFK